MWAAAWRVSTADPAALRRRLCDARAAAAAALRDAAEEDGEFAGVDPSLAGRDSARPAVRHAGQRGVADAAGRGAPTKGEHPPHHPRTLACAPTPFRTPRGRLPASGRARFALGSGG
eukprot:gene8934-15029_t